MSKRKRHFSEIDISKSPSTKHVKKMLTLEQKIELTREAETVPAPTQAFLSAKYIVGRSAISEILSRREFFKENLTNALIKYTMVC